MTEVEVELIVHNEWSSSLALEDAYKLDDVREALRLDDLDTAAENAILYDLHPLAIGSRFALPSS